MSKKVTLTISRGEEVYGPIQYQSFRVGGGTVTVTVDEEDVDREVEKWSQMLARAARKRFDEQLREHLERVRVAASAARSRAGAQGSDD